jgi:hypothetical protein
MKKLRKAFGGIVISVCFSLVATSAFALFNPVSAYAWECCTAHCSLIGCAGYNVTCCGAYCFGTDNVGCTSYYADGEQLNCKQCDCPRPFICN